MFILPARHMIPLEFSISLSYSMFLGIWICVRWYHAPLLPLIQLQSKYPWLRYPLYHFRKFWYLYFWYQPAYSSFLISRIVLNKLSLSQAGNLGNYAYLVSVYSPYWFQDLYAGLSNLKLWSFIYHVSIASV